MESDEHKEEIEWVWVSKPIKVSADDLKFFRNEKRGYQPDVEDTPEKDDIGDNTRKNASKHEK